ncbi:dual specificity protein phosphatase family protein [Paenibacillus mesotrionivorans]|jgi:protein-tyrosine phosphatase|uniref:Dual specificity protein phosphatase family protein n=1 Tax=Paenibacillus mesotrionivorans TaxID=3160968 RepID=A0ACC7NYC2_9BACL
MNHSYHMLVENSIYFGGAKDVQDMIEQEGVEVVVDLREEAEGCAYPKPGVVWIQVPLGDEAEEPQAELFKQAIAHVVGAHKEGKKVAFHCGGGKGRTGAVAVGTLMELEMANSLEEAEQKAKAIRPIISVKPAQWEALQSIYKK